MNKYKSEFINMHKMLALARIFERLDFISYEMSWSNPPSPFHNCDKLPQNHPITTSQQMSTDNILATSHVLSAFGHHIQIDIFVILPSSSLQLNNFSCVSWEKIRKRILLHHTMHMCKWCICNPRYDLFIHCNYSVCNNERTAAVCTQIIHFQALIRVSGMF